MNIASLFNLGGPDLIIILFIVLILFGAKKLPELARGLGQAVKEFSKAKDEFEREVSRPPEPAPVQRLEQPPTPVAPAAAATAANAETSANAVHDSHDSHDPHGDQAHEAPPLTRVI